jgi:two-component system, response regulator FlrC
MVTRRRSSHRASPNPHGAAPQATVLVVDDEASVRETIAEVLSLANYPVIPAASEQEAEEIMQRLGEVGIHLVIVDVYLTSQPQARTGYVLAQRWRAMRPGLPVILISGDSRNQDLPDVRSGAMYFLLKPFRMEALLEAVQEALSG